ncbi:amino acid adenylation domain-containing protein [Kitasatospora sp. NPDC002040]|uniref:non-ribosomal peptide synthetase n=1 Tax=Kitasatospora sp. NPDC002040 TaxID=3154661 RepID=UPI0033319952
MQSALESVLVQTWRRITGLAAFTATDDLAAPDGHTGRAAEFSAALRQILAVDITPEEIAGHRTVAHLARRVEELRESTTADAVEVDGSEASMTPPASFGQTGFWYLDQYSPNPSIYNAPIVLKTGFPVDLSLLEQSLRTVVARHEALRTTFHLLNGELVQNISPEPRFAFAVRKFTDDSQYQRILREVMDPPFDLTHGPLLRVVCAVDDTGRTRVLCNVHHMVFDATSAEILLGEWFTEYVRLRDGRAPVHGLPPVQYQEFARRQRERLDPDSLERMLGYWEKKLAGPLPLLDLPLDRPRTVPRLQAGDVARFQVPARLTDALRKRSAEEGVTFFMLLLSAYTVFLHKYARQQDILVGSPASLRDSPETQGVIGYLVNMMVFRHRLDGGMTLSELHGAVRDEVIDSLRHKHVPVEQIVERVQPERSGSHPPVFQTMFAMPRSDPELFTRLGLDVETELYGSRSAKYDLSLIVEEDRNGTGGLSGAFEYDTGLFGRSTAEAMGRHFLHILDQFVRTPQARVGDIRLLDPEQERTTLAASLRVRSKSELRPVMDHFRRQVERTPDQEAVVHEHDGESLTYRELDARANRMAHCLRSRGIAAGSRVAVFMRRSTDQIVALLGVLKSGAAYVPIDPSYPPDRIAYALRDSEAELVVTDSALGGLLPGGHELLVVDREHATLAASPATDPGPVKTPDDEIYVIYTSGSTGRPKGVVLTDATIANLVEHQLDITAVGAGARTLQYMSLSFDVSIQEILGTLCAGGTLVLIPEELQKDLHRLAEFMAHQRIARAYFPYIALQQLAAVAVAGGIRLEALEEVVSTGEQLVLSPQIREFFAAHPRAKLWNMYGPSESHVVSVHRLDGDPARWGETAPIGRPVPGFSLLVLDGSGHLVPPGIPGELHLGGLVSPGYHRLPEESARRFIAHPLAAAVPSTGGRLYRTGDLVRINADGDFEYLGRTDAQVKVRGYRIEPSEVEAALNGLDFVSASAVAAVPLDDGDRRLVAFLVARERVESTVVRELLRPLLPGYMVPSHFVLLDRLPTAPSGKIDRKALPALFRPEAPAAAAPSAVPPGTPTEREVADRWRELLQSGAVGAHDDFFALGGHSILAVRLVERLRTDFGVDIALGALLDRPTVAGMAATIDALVAPGGAPRPAASAAGLRAEARLPDRVAVPEKYAADREFGHRRTAGAREVLLTGATGFLGTYLLRDLLAHTDARVHCLVRAESPEHARRRLTEAARRYGLGHALDGHRVVPVPGDLAEDRMGLDGQTYAALSDAVDAVYHSAAQINFVAPYASVKATNVDGMSAVIEFCADGVPKPLHHASTIAVFSRAEDQGVITEASVPREPEQLGIGYTRSKWVAEQLARAARERGLPVTVYRMGRIAGDSITGACQADDFLWRQVKSFVQLGSAPPADQLHTDLLPVDFVSRALVLLSRQPGHNETYHLFHPEGADFQVVHHAIRKAGYPLEVVPGDAWFAALERSVADGAGNALAAAVPLFQEGVLELGENEYANDATRRSLRRLGLEFPAIEAGSVSRMIDYFQRTGELQ